MPIKNGCCNMAALSSGNATLANGSSFDQVVYLAGSGVI